VERVARQRNLGDSVIRESKRRKSPLH
jgi:hypothetical protein